MVSVIIAAHNEESVIGPTLDALLSGTSAQPLEIVTVANGCTDDTADVARSRDGVLVVNLDEGSKPKALNAGERVVGTFPRIYLDADILVPPGGVDSVLAALSPSTLAAVPARRVAVTGRPWPVRAYFAVNERLPAFDTGLFGRGMIALSAQARARFDRFPDLVADDMFLDAHFTTAEKTVVSNVTVVVEAPFTTRDLLRRLIRVRRGMAAIRRAGAEGVIQVRVRSSDRWSWLRDVVLVRPRLIPAGVAYFAITLTAALLARRGQLDSMAWGRDESTRRARVAD